MNTKPTLHRDGTVSLWSVYTQSWERTASPSDRDLAAMDADDRRRVRLHTETVTDRQIAALRDEAGVAGDSKAVAICDRALAGSARARREAVVMVLDL